MIEFRRVSKIYLNGTHALKNVSFTIQNGDFVFVIGRSGAGKSTLIKLLTCEEKPSEGSVLIDDFDIANIRRKLIPYLRRNVGMVFQDFRLIETKTVYENVAFAMEIVGSSSKSIRRRVPIVLSIVGLRDKTQARPGELSGGEQQRVAIARAMVNNPMLILADEPTGNLDPTNSESVMALLDEINRAGTTVIICTHDRDLVDRMQKRVIQIEDGCLVRDDCQGSYAATNPVCQPKGQNSGISRHLDLDKHDPDPDEHDPDPEPYQILSDSRDQPDQGTELPSREHRPDQDTDSGFAPSRRRMSDRRHRRRDDYPLAYSARIRRHVTLAADPDQTVQTDLRKEPLLQQDPEPLPQQDPEPLPQQDPEPLPQQGPEPLPQQGPEPLPQQDPEPLPQQDPEPLPQQDPESDTERRAEKTGEATGA